MDPDAAHFAAAHADMLSALEAAADATLLVDNHAHPFHLPDPDSTLFALPRLVQLISEAPPLQPTPDDPLSIHPVNHARASLAFCRAVRDMHRLVVSDPSRNESVSSSLRDGNVDEAEDASNGSATHPSPREHGLDAQGDAERVVEDVRSRMGVWPLAERCFGAAGIAAVLLDDGLRVPPGARPVPLADITARLNVPVAKRVLRLETEAEFVLEEVVARNEHDAWTRAPRSPLGHDGTEKRPRTTLRARQFRNAIRAKLDPLPADVVAFKSIAAYRSGLGVRLDWSDEDLEDALASMSFSGVTAGPSRTNDGPRIRFEKAVIIDCVVRAGLDAARQHTIPVQFHCGFGDPDLDLLKANPLLLRSVFQQYPDVNIVLLHAAWPHTRAAAYLTSVYPAVYLDLGLAIPLLSVRGMFRAMDEALEIAPITKLLYSSDAHSAPDVFYLAARWGRRVVAAAIAAAVVSGDLGQAEAKAAIRKILAENAVRLYKLPVSV